jgi:hypothetical protein
MYAKDGFTGDPQEVEKAIAAAKHLCEAYERAPTAARMYFFAKLGMLRSTAEELDRQERRDRRAQKKGADHADHWRFTCGASYDIRAGRRAGFFDGPARRCTGGV